MTGEQQFAVSGFNYATVIFIMVSCAIFSVKSVAPDYSYVTVAFVAVISVVL